jgi:hypothetical protein
MPDYVVYHECECYALRIWSLADDYHSGLDFKT